MRSCLLVAIAACGSSTRAPTPTPSPSPVVADAAPAGPSVRDVDWMNRTYDLDYLGTYTVVDGALESDDGYVTIGEPVFGDVTGDGVEEALVTRTHTSGAGMLDDLAVYGLRDGEPVLLGTIPGSKEAYPPIRGVALDGAVVVVERAGGGDRWRWDGAAFVAE